jgi:hypothetical protein
LLSLKNTRLASLRYRIRCCEFGTAIQFEKDSYQGFVSGHRFSDADNRQGQSGFSRWDGMPEGMP